MAIFSAGVIFDGFASFELEAKDANAAEIALSSAKVVVQLLDARGDVVGSVQEIIMTHKVESVERRRRPSSLSAYHRPPFGDS